MTIENQRFSSSIDQHYHSKWSNKGQLNLKMLREVMITTTHVNCMVFIILQGASMFSLVFRGFEGDEVVRGLLTNLPGGMVSAFLVVMLIMFIMGFSSTFSKSLLSWFPLSVQFA